ncbi:MAG: hypothetical protein K2I85_01665 [Alistipes sp.]|nr:hypothetical protein [Alistipes sp.]
MKSSRSFFLLLAVGLFVGCNDKSDKNDDSPFSMKPSELAGTYWKETERSVCRNGEWSGNMLGNDEDAAPACLCFDTAEQATEYIPSTTGKANYRRRCVFGYDTQKKTLSTDMHALGCYSLSTVEATCFTAARMAFEVQSSGSEICRHVFSRYDPTENELQELAAYTDYSLVKAMPIPEPEPLTMIPEALTGTYWEQTTECTYEYRRNELVCYWENWFGAEGHETLVGGAGPAYWSFEADDRFWENVPVGMMMADFDRANSRGSYTYNPESRTLLLNGTSANPAARNLTLLRCNAEEIVFAVQEGSAPDHTLRIDYFTRIHPTDEELDTWLRYPDYDDLTWN